MIVFHQLKFLSFLSKISPFFDHDSPLFLYNKKIGGTIPVIATVKKIVVLIRRSVAVSDELKRLQIFDGKPEGTALKFILDVPNILVGIPLSIC